MFFTSNRHRLTLREFNLVSREVEWADDVEAGAVEAPAAAVIDSRTSNPSFLLIGSSGTHEVYYGGLGAAQLDVIALDATCLALA